MWSVQPLIGIAKDTVLARWVREHFERLQTHLQAPQDALVLRVLHAEPVRYSEGVLVLADGSDWDPGSGAGLYIRRGGAWVHLG